ncbi:MAG: glutamate--cysteine ligase, partial [Burkholderiales bacterium]
AKDDYLVYNYNRFQACRFGMDGSLVHSKSHEIISLREDILTTLRKIEPYSEELGSLDALTHLSQATHQISDANYLRQQYMSRGSTEGIVESALRRFRGAE